MAGADDLLRRLDSEFGAAEKRTEEKRAQKVDAYHQRLERIEKFGQVVDRLREVWKPRLEAFAKRFGDGVKVTPTVEPGHRAAKFAFDSELAQIEMRLSASPDEEVQNVVLAYDLRILPMLMQFESHAQLSQPLDQVDEAAVGKWIDDRLVQFAQTYLALHENQYYLKEHMVEDPIARVQFPKYGAGCSLAWEGKTYYFISEETRDEFQKQQNISQ